MKRTDVYKLIKQGRYDDAAFLLLQDQVPEYGSRISSPSDVFPFLRKYGAKRKELFIILLLNGSHEMMREEVISIGIANRTIVHPREIFFPAITHNAVAIIACHNHPSGKLDPSAEDIEITNRLKQASDILGIPLLDHFIISRKGYFSFLEHGLLDPTADFFDAYK